MVSITKRGHQASFLSGFFDSGLLVVVIITLILWKFGFFERKRVSDVAHSVKISKQYPPLMNGNEYIS